jgi:hypothetical protein
LKNKAFLTIIGKIGKIPGYIYTYRRGGDAWMRGCVDAWMRVREVGGRMHHVYIYKKKSYNSYKKGDAPK